MLHFLIGTALCIWIAERIAHYWSEWRWRRQQRRYVRWLKGEDIRSGLPPWVKLSPQPEPEMEHRRDTYVTVGLCVAFAGVLLAIAIH